MMPKTLTLIRHGESESNLAHHLAEHGAPHPNEAELMRRHTSERRLTPLGVEQAQAAGAWIHAWMQENQIAPLECRFYVSPYIRTLETAGHMQIRGRRWRPDSRLVERNWGQMDQLTYKERAERYGDTLGLRKEHALFWRPGGDGETMLGVLVRYRDLVDTMHRECENMHVIIVAHGELMWAARYAHEYWMPYDLRDAMLHRTSQTDMHNCRVIQYSRLLADGTEAKRLERVRFVDPMAPDDPGRNCGWVPVSRRLYSSDDLLEFVEDYKRHLFV